MDLSVGVFVIVFIVGIVLFLQSPDTDTTQDQSGEILKTIKFVTYPISALFTTIIETIGHIVYYFFVDKTKTTDKAFLYGSRVILLLSFGITLVNLYMVQNQRNIGNIKFKITTLIVVVFFYFSNLQDLFK